MNNNDRAERVAAGLRMMYEEGHMIEQSLGDLLCDIRHLCDRENLPFEHVNCMGFLHYEAEVAEEQSDQRQTK